MALRPIVSDGLPPAAIFTAGPRADTREVFRLFFIVKDGYFQQFEVYHKKCSGVKGRMKIISRRKQVEENQKTKMRE